MAILRLNPNAKLVEAKFLKTACAEFQDSDEFINFRREFIKYQNEFASRPKKASSEHSKTNEDQLSNEDLRYLYGAAYDRALQVRKYNIDLYIDFNLSKRRAKEIFEHTSKTIWQQIENMYADEKNKFMPDYVTEYPTMKNGKKADTKKLFEVWDKALKVYDLYESQDKKNKAEISRQLGWFDKDNRNRSTEQVGYYLKVANRLIMAAIKMELYEEACKAITAGKKRNKVDKSTT